MAEKRKPRKKGQHTGSPNHSDLYTNEREKGTIRGLGFKDAATARKGVATVNKAKRTHAHKVQATLVMKQRAKVAKERAKDPEKKKNLNSAYKIWSDHLEKLKKKTAKKNESFIRDCVKSMLEYKSYQSHTFEPSVGDKVVNTNKKCKHYGSIGIVKRVLKLPEEAGKVAEYKCTNSGKNWQEKDILSKSLDQLSPFKIIQFHEVKKTKLSKRRLTESQLRKIIRKEILAENAQDSRVSKADSRKYGLRAYIRELIYEMGAPVPHGRWTMLSAGDPRRELVKQNLFDLVQQTYEPIGGHFKISSPDSLERYTYWVVKDIDDDPDIDVAIMGKPDVGGAKMGAAANDGSAQAAAEYKNKSAELRAGGTVGGVGNWWGEVSGKPAYVMISRGAKAVEDPNKVAQLLAGDDYIFHGEHPDPNAPAVFKSVKGWYTKKFGDKSSTKIILGNPS